MDHKAGDFLTTLVGRYIFHGILQTGKQVDIPEIFFDLFY